MKFIPLVAIGFILTGAFLSSCESEVNNPCDTCQNPCDTCIPCDTCDTTDPCDTCDTTNPPDPNDTTNHDFTWTEYTIPGEVNITGAYVVNDNLIQVIGTYFYQWDGTEWKKQRIYVPATHTDAEFADFTMFNLNANQRWMVGWGTAFYCDGGTAIRYDVGEIRACWGTGFNDMFFVGINGSIYHFDGEKFEKFPQVTTKRLADIWGTSHSNVWAAGFNYETDESVLLHFDGVEWKEDEFSSSGKARQYGIGSVWCGDSAGHTVVTITGTRVWRKTDNGPWRMDTSEIGNSLGGGSYVGLGIRGDTPNNMIVAGGWGMVSHWNGKTWHKFKELYDYSLPTYGAECLSIKGNTIFVGGGGSRNGVWLAVGRRKP